MLILTRKVEQALLIGKDVVVKVISIERGRVKLGIEADKNVIILRDELARKKPPIK